jgi:hypothetical protein
MMLPSMVKMRENNFFASWNVGYYCYDIRVMLLTSELNISRHLIVWEATQVYLMHKPEGIALGTKLCKSVRWEVLEFRITPDAPGIAFLDWKVLLSWLQAIF